MGTWAVRDDETMDVSEIGQSPTPPFSIDLSPEEPTILEPATLEVRSTPTGEPSMTGRSTRNRAGDPSAGDVPARRFRGETVEEEFELLVQGSGEHRVVARRDASEDVRRLPSVISSDGKR